jgi:molybdate transport system substrate-binding protein
VQAARGSRWLASSARAILALALACSLQPRTAAAQSERLVVFAAASLKNALDAVGGQWERKAGRKVVVSYAASSALARQIEQGAPAQIFISADLDWMDYLAAKGLVAPGSRSNLLGNRLVLIAPKDKARAIEIKPGFDIAGVLGPGRLAMANVDAVPAGKYGKAALEKLGVWAGVAGRVAQAENVRAALLLVSRAEATAGIVYRSDAAADPGVAIIGTFPENSHPAIVYPVARLAGTTHPDADRFLAYLKSPEARPAFEAQGFTVLGAGQS